MFPFTANLTITTRALLDDIEAVFTRHASILQPEVKAEKKPSAAPTPAASANTAPTAQAQQAAASASSAENSGVAQASTADTAGNAQQPATAQAPATTGASGTAPDTAGNAGQGADTQGDDLAPAEPVTYEQAAAAVTGLARAKGRDAAVTVLKQFGAAKLPDVKPEQFAAVVAACTQAMGV